MARPLRLEFPGAIYHVTSRGDRQEDIFLNDDDRDDWLEILGIVSTRFNWVVHAYCQMTNHFHIVVETIDGNLSRGMRQLNGLYTQRFNRRHGMAGHLFQGRYKAILVQREAYLLELSRYVVLNPLRVNMISSLDDWRWSSYPSMVGNAPVPAWLNTAWLLSQFGASRAVSVSHYRQFVMAGVGLPSPILNTQHQLLLGDADFIERHQLANPSEQLREVSKAQRKSIALSLDEYATRAGSRNQAIADAYASGAYTMAEIGLHFGVHYMTVSRFVRQSEAQKKLAEQAEKLEC
jgi:REP element-mobilizing transposase RayT